MKNLSFVFCCSLKIHLFTFLWPAAVVSTAALEGQASMAKQALGEDLGRLELRYTCCGFRGAKVKQSFHPASRNNYANENLL